MKIESGIYLILVAKLQSGLKWKQNSCRGDQICSHQALKNQVPQSQALQFQALHQSFQAHKSHKQHKQVIHQLKLQRHPVGIMGLSLFQITANVEATASIAKIWGSQNARMASGALHSVILGQPLIHQFSFLLPYSKAKSDQIQETHTRKSFIYIY